MGASPTPERGGTSPTVASCAALTRGSPSASTAIYQPTVKLLGDQGRTSQMSPRGLRKGRKEGEDFLKGSSGVRADASEVQLTTSQI